MYLLFGASFTIALCMTHKQTAVLHSLSCSAACARKQNSQPRKNPKMSVQQNIIHLKVAHPHCVITYNIFQSVNTTYIHQGQGYERISIRPE